VSLKKWMTKNLHVTSPNDPNPFFHPRRYRKSKEEVVKAAREVVASLSGWRVEEYRENQGRLHVTRAFFLFLDDINLYITQSLDGVVQLEMTSQSRAGKGDWGRNERNVRKFLSKMDSLLTPEP